ncbi:acyltransferase family protein [Mycolicibacterium sphagni]|uniref:Acyltransferase n=1 Tax=Mycolicibacterium sphagni TaxID=1786 RepID=A0A255DT46_9MYCO|nr:acyltransferase family protein [Mycolicibacterium sphagni]OYN80405.1 hypothetical protein CG716_09740 [Mycolicibacterium sphagni]
MATVLERYQKKARRRRKRAARKHVRLDIQGLRMLAVLTVFANHLWHWPAGGFVGVDVFFVISGFLITGNLLRAATERGNVSFRTFYWNRVRRIVPAAVVTLLATYVVSVLLFKAFRAHEVGIDALFAFVFLSNWWFGAKGTDYFNSDETVSPIQHFWSLSIEEQFYFVWPALIFLISVIVARKAWNNRHRMQLAGALMGVIIAASLTWAVYETATDRAWAYFDTFTRVWELGAGALLACCVGVFALIPARSKPYVSWAGVALIAASLFLITDSSDAFPAPWALLPVAGAALVIIAGVGGEPKYQDFLQNPLSTYIGDISYSLYLVHWPIIVFVSAAMKSSVYSSILVVGLAFSLAIASYHFIETPLRRAEWGNTLETMRKLMRERSSVYAATAVAVLLVVSVSSYALRPSIYSQHAVPPQVVPANISAPEPDAPPPAPLGPLTSALQTEIQAAIKATQWPQLDPTMESVVSGSILPPDLVDCSYGATPNADQCTWRSPTAPTQVVIVGDSVATIYAASLRAIAQNSNGRIRVVSEAIGNGCAFTNVLVSYDPVSPDCEARKQNAVDLINNTKPNVVIISNRYKDLRVPGAPSLSPTDEAVSLRQIIDKFRPSAGKVVLLAPPPGDVNIKQCFGDRANGPADCLGSVSSRWQEAAGGEQSLAQSIGGVWIDSRPWFCAGGYCPSFVASTPTKRDATHMSSAYAEKIAPVIGESLAAAGIN